MLVTGCAGFIGSHLTEALLDEGYEVIGVDCFEEYYARGIKEHNLKKALGHPRFTFIEGDLRGLDLAKILDGVECVMHQAAVPGVRRSWGRHFRDYIENNILATQILLEACKEKNLKRFVYASSSSVYGNVEELPISESARTIPFSPYGVSKLAGENLAILYHKNYGIPVIALRYFTIYGPRQRPDMSFHKFLLAIHLGKEIEVYGNGRQTRDFTFIESAVRANLLAVSGGVIGEVYNIGGGSTIELIKAIETMEDVVQKKAKLVFLEAQKGDAAHTHADIGKAKRELGFHPDTELSEGLRIHYDWLKRHISLYT